MPCSIRDAYVYCTYYELHRQTCVGYVSAIDSAIAIAPLKLIFIPATILLYEFNYYVTLYSRPTYPIY